MLDLNFIDKNSSTIPKKRLLLFYIALTILPQYIKERVLDSVQLSGNVWSYRLGIAMKIGSFVNYCLFLLNGKYLTLERRVLGLRIAHGSRPTLGEIHK